MRDIWAEPRETEDKNTVKNTWCDISIGQSFIVPGAFRGRKRAASTTAVEPKRRQERHLTTPQRGQPAAVCEIPLAAWSSAPGHPTRPIREPVALFRCPPRLVGLEIAQAQHSLEDGYQAYHPHSAAARYRLQRVGGF